MEKIRRLFDVNVVGTACCTLAPGVMLTDTIRAGRAAETLSRIKSMQYISADGEEQGIVDAMLFLTGPTAKFITGETLRVTGGFAAGI